MGKRDLAETVAVGASSASKREKHDKHKEKKKDKKKHEEEEEVEKEAATESVVVKEKKSKSDKKEKEKEKEKESKKSSKKQSSDNSTASSSASSSTGAAAAAASSSSSAAADASSKKSSSSSSSSSSKKKSSSSSSASAAALPVFGENYEQKVKHVVKIAVPLASKKLAYDTLHAVQKIAKTKNAVRRGVKEVGKALRKGEKGLVVLAGDISPIDVISHLPVTCEERRIPYVYVPSKSDLGAACCTKRPTSVVLVNLTVVGSGNSEINSVISEVSKLQPHLKQ